MFYIRHPTLPCAIKVMKGLCRTVLFTQGCWASGFPVACLSSRQAPQMTHALPTALEIPRYTRWHLSWLSYTCSLDLLGPSRQYPSPMESSNLFVPLRIRSDRLMKHAWSNRHRLRRMYPDPGIGCSLLHTDLWRSPYVVEVTPGRIQIEGILSEVRDSKVLLTSQLLTWLVYDIIAWFVRNGDRFSKSSWLFSERSNSSERVYEAWQEW